MQCKLEKHKLKTMNFRKCFTVFLLTFVSLFSSLSAKDADISTLKGQPLSNDLYTFMNKQNTLPYAQPLLNNGTNEFAYNIFVNFEKDKSQKNLLLVFSQEQIIEKKQLISNLINYINTENPDCNITLLFSYGDIQKIEKRFIIYGSEVFIDSINTNEDYTAILIDLNNKNNKVLTSSNKHIAPSWLIKNEYSIYMEEGLSQKLPFYYISQIFSLNIFEEDQLELFLKNNIPSIKLCLTDSISNSDKALNIITKSIKLFTETKVQNWEQHFLLINFFGKYFNLEESALIKIIITIIFFWLLYVFILGFVNTNIKSNTVKKLSKIWFSIPITYILCYLSFIFIRTLFNLFSDKLSTINTIYYCCLLQIIFSFSIITFVDIFILRFNFKFSEDTLDFLLVITCFINQSLFILIDISLLPIYMVFFFLSVLAYYFKNNVFHILVLLIYILALVPYGNIIILNGNYNQIKKYILINPITPATISLTFSPIFILYLRVLTSLRRKFTKNNSIVIFSIISYLLIALSLFIFTFFRTKTLSRNNEYTQNYIITNSDDKKISLNYSDKLIFTDIIRTIEIDFEEIPEDCEVQISTADETPVLYSDNDYEYISHNAVVFKTTKNPPKHLTFSYGANEEPCNVIISAIYPSNNNEMEYNLIKKVVSIGDK